MEARFLEFGAFQRAVLFHAKSERTPRIIHFHASDQIAPKVGHFGYTPRKWQSVPPFPSVYPSARLASNAHAAKPSPARIA
jgi:hypothetical protein